jgi:hypothetical protein
MQKSLSLITYNVHFRTSEDMNEDMKRQEKLQSKGEDDPTLRNGEETERERSTKRSGTGVIEKIKPASSREVSPNTPSGEDL